VAVYLAWFYRERTKSCRLLILSRREPVPADFGVERHADDMIRTVERLGRGRAVWECLSAGGPIGQWVAVKRPDLVRGLILSSSFDHVAGRTQKVFQQWLNIVEETAGADLFWGMIEQKYRPPAEALSGIDPAILPSAAAPRDPERLKRTLKELFHLDQREIVPRIACPSLVIGGEADRVVPADVQRQMAARMPESRLELCPGYGHFNDMENPAYPGHIDRFVESLARMD
jgi:3-oxoadipate enol-lactonase